MITHLWKVRENCLFKTLSSSDEPSLQLRNCSPSQLRVVFRSLQPKAQHWVPRLSGIYKISVFICERVEIVLKILSFLAEDTIIEYAVCECNRKDRQFCIFARL